MTGKELRKYRRENGLCTVCGKPVDTTGAICESCRKKKRERERDSYEFYQRMGICPRCRKNKLYGKEKKCPECRAKEAERSLRRTQSPEDKSRWNRDHRQRLKDKGICICCGKRKAEDGHTMCRICMDKKAAYQRVRRNTPLCGIRNYRAAHGICYICGKNPCMDDKKVCTACYSACMANLGRAMIVYKSLYPH